MTTPTQPPSVGSTGSSSRSQQQQLFGIGQSPRSVHYMGMPSSSMGWASASRHPHYMGNYGAGRAGVTGPVPMTGPVHMAAGQFPVTGPMTGPVSGPMAAAAGSWRVGAG